MRTAGLSRFQRLRRRDRILAICHYAIRCYAVRRYAVRHYAVWHYAVWHYTFWHYTVRRPIVCRFAIHRRIVRAGCIVRLCSFAQGGRPRHFVR